MKDKYIVLLWIGFIVSLIGGVVYVAHANEKAYHDVLDPARAVIQSKFMIYGINVSHSNIDWDKYPGHNYRETDSLGVFMNKCRMENASMVYPRGESSFCVYTSEYNMVWEYRIRIRAYRKSPNPFYTFTWENRPVDEINETPFLTISNPDGIDTSDWTVSNDYILDLALEGFSRSDIESVSVSPRINPSAGNTTKLQGEYWVVRLTHPWRENERETLVMFYTPSGIYTHNYTVTEGFE